MKCRWMMRALLTICVSWLAIAGVKAQESSVTYDPAKTTVALLPVINSSGEKDANFRAKQIKAAGDALRKEFSERGFQIVDGKAIEEAAAAAKIDLNDEEQHSRSTLINIGSAVKADLAVFVVINKKSQKLKPGLFSNTMEGRAKVTIWLVDVKTQKAILTAAPHESKADSGFFGAYQKGSDKIFGACAKAVHEGLAVVLKPYKMTKQKESGGN